MRTLKLSLKVCPCLFFSCVCVCVLHVCNNNTCGIEQPILSHSLQPHGLCDPLNPYNQAEHWSGFAISVLHWRTMKRKVECDYVQFIALPGLNFDPIGCTSLF